MVECRLAAMVLAVALGAPPAEAVAIKTVKEVEPLIIAKYGPGAEAQDKAVRELLHEGVYMPDEVRGLRQARNKHLHDLAVWSFYARWRRAAGEEAGLFVVDHGDVHPALCSWRRQVAGPRQLSALIKPRYQHPAKCLLAYRCACCMQIESLLGKQLSNIYEGNASALRVLGVVGPEGFKLQHRALHVYSEAGRVYAFRNVCQVGAGRQ